MATENIVKSGNLPPFEKGNPTDNYFNNITTIPRGTSSDKNNALVSFFEKWTGSVEGGQALTATVLYTAENQNIDPMDVINQMMKLDKKQLNSYLTLFLNLNRIGTSLLAIGNTPDVDKYIIRAILP
jgi:hypothetical protein